MPRSGRRKSKNGIYHIVLRGINRQTIFEEEDDSIKFLETLKNYKEKSGYKIYGYCLMGNHIHLLIKEEKEDLGIIMRRIGASYVYWYNLKYDRYGHLFQDRYKSEVVEDESYFLTVLRYIHQNPIKAGMVPDVGSYKWSSYIEYIGKKEIVDTDFILGLFSRDRKKALESFEAFHRISNDERCLDISENKRLTDKIAIEIIKSKCRVNCCSEIQSMGKNQRDRYLKLLKEEGLSTRQIARLTSISRGIVLKA
jgi:REP element-mobilizing transposase RayT